MGPRGWLLVALFAVCAVLRLTELETHPGAALRR